MGRCSVNEYIACHDFHFLLSVFGPDVASVFAQKIHSRVQDEVGVADSYWNLIRWENGGSASVLMSWGMPAASDLVEDEVLIIGSEGSAEKLPNHSLRFTTDEKDQQLEPDPSFTGYEEYQDQMLHFADMVRNGVAPAVTLKRGLLIQKLVWAAEESTTTGCPVEVEL
jgi:predicted dehydrogenase